MNDTARDDFKTALEGLIDRHGPGERPLRRGTDRRAGERY
jgi:hypothetical protein